MTNPTAQKFGHPSTLVAETAHWLVLVRPQQPTLGSLVLVCKEAAGAFSELTPAAFADLRVAVEGIERLLSDFVGYARINYLMLMMVDRRSHLPRRRLAGPAGPWVGRRARPRPGGGAGRGARRPLGPGLVPRWTVCA
jgi:diadenosine tetraphosphate (Ap4A) HIT family hydrolase